jgi:O-antigen ligase
LADKQIIFGIILGLLVAILAPQVARLEPKYFYSVIIAVWCVAILLLVKDRQHFFYILLVLYCLSIPINLDINFLIRPHEGGAAGITISLSLLSAAALLFYIIFIYHPYTISPESPPVRVNFVFFWPCIIYMVAGVASLFNALHYELVFFELFRIATLIMILLLTMNFGRIRHLRVFLIFLIVGMCLEGTLACIQYATGKTIGLALFGEEHLVKQNIGFLFSRATGTIGHPNFLAYYFEILLPLTFAMFLGTQNRWTRLFCFVALMIGLAGILTTLSRGSWITLPLSFTLVFLVLYGKRLFHIKTALYLVLAGIIVVIGLVFAYPTIEKRFIHDDYKSAAMRMPLNRAAFSIIKQFPVVGIGMNNFVEVFSKYDTTGKSRILRGGKNPVHNLYLLVWAEVGLFGFLAFLSIFAATFMVIKRLLFEVSFWYRAVLIGIASGLMAHMIHGLFDVGFKANLPVSILIFSLIGIVGAIDLIHRDYSTSGVTRRDKNYGDRN